MVAMIWDNPDETQARLGWPWRSTGRRTQDWGFGKTDLATGRGGRTVRIVGQSEVPTQRCLNVGRKHLHLNHQWGLLKYQCRCLGS